MQKDSPALELIVGLGNPGDTYRGTRHNMGFDFLDLLAAKTSGVFRDEPRYFGEVARIRIRSRELWLLKPTTFMNLSGQAVQALSSYFKIAPASILVAHDELDILPGTMRLKFAGGNAGHNGLKDITSKLSTPNFWRLRLGIGHPRVFCPEMQVYDWVLGHPVPEHRTAIDKCQRAALDAVDLLVDGEFQRAERAINRFSAVEKKEADGKDEGNKK